MTRCSATALFLCGTSLVSPVAWALDATPGGGQAPAAAPRPPLRMQVTLNGTWDEGGAVPQYTGVRGFDRRTYRRRVDVPAGWRGRVIKVEFGAVNFVADVAVDGRPVARHVGGWTPFAVDVTGHATPGGSFEMAVDVRGPKHPPIVDGRGKFAWPVGGWSDRGGIADDVWLRAYGPVHVEDAFIKTSVRERTLAVEYTLVNATDRPRAVRVEAEASPAGGGGVEEALGADVRLEARERRVVTVAGPWADPTLYWPDRPALYVLRTRVVEGGTTLDEEARRFGFREVGIAGNQFTWNGVRANLYGDYQSYGDTWYVDPATHAPENWPRTVERLKALNIRVLRWHHNPVPRHVLDVMDEQGLLCCDESANYARTYLVGCDRDAYVANFATWAEGWVKADRNHPCVYLWNATNEMTYDHLGDFTAAHCAAMGAAIRRHDPTRPVGYDGDAHGGLRKDETVDAECLNLHYPEGYNREPTGSVDSWARFVHPSRPTGTGECLHTRSPLPEVQEAVERNTWWLGIWTRGLRHDGWTDVRPACSWFALRDLESPDPLRRQRGLNLRNAYAPVALFDKAYDDLGIAPYVTGTTPGGTLPRVMQGETMARALVLYNDEFRGTAVDVEVLVRAGGQVYARGEKAVTMPLGHHDEFSCEFQVPYVGGELELVLRTAKEGVAKFEEVRRFEVVDRGLRTKSSSVVSIQGPR